MHQPPGNSGNRHDNHRAGQQQGAVHRGEAGEERVLQHVEGIGIEHALHELGEAAEQDAEDDADQHKQGQAALLAQEQPAEQQRGEHHHRHHFERELPLRIDGGKRANAQEEHHRRLDQHVKGVKAHDGWREDAIVGGRLEQHGGDGDRIGDQHQG